jgi:S-adenosylmethionine:tRNA ribosyltransferase-isomerase
MRTDEFDFELPAERIALRPCVPRDAARMLLVRPGGHPQLADHTIRHLPDLLRPGDAVVVNDTKVIPARLRGRRLGRGNSEPAVEATLHRRLDGSRWRAFVKPGKRVVPGDVLRFGTEGKVCFLGQLDATVEAKEEGGEIILAFAFHGPVLDEAVNERGEMPLPPYIAGRRAPDEQDRADYQTVFARAEGSVAAPTASLHFTDDLVARLRARGIALHTATLHVGAGTFLPIKAASIEQHVMQSETAELSAETATELNRVRQARGRIVAVGSTALRLLESATDDVGLIHAFAGETNLFIKPGYRFQAVDALMTNFHLPRSTLFVLVAAFSGLETMKRAYAHALATGYRFYSYGDACLLFPARVKEM